MAAKAATRYANAYIETAMKQKKLEKAKSDISLVRETLDNSSELRLFLISPLIKKEVKKAALLEIFKDKVDDLTVSLLNLLSEKGRENLLFGITESFNELYNEYKGIIEVYVTAGFDMADNQKSSLQKKLESETGKKVQMYTTVDKSLIGGLQVRIDDTVIDGSVKYKLSQLKETFTAEAVK